MAKNGTERPSLLHVAMDRLSEKYSPVKTEKQTEKGTMSTEFVQDYLSGLADFDRDSIAEQLYSRGYSIENTGIDMAWVYYARIEDIRL